MLLLLPPSETKRDGGDDLTQDIREASDQLKRLIGGIKPPGA